MNKRMRLRILVAPTCFKEGLAAEQVASAMARGAAMADGTAEVTELPLSDGGEGFTRMLARATGATLRAVRVHGPLGEGVQAELAELHGQSVPTVALEIASASGLRLVPPSRRDPCAATSRGVGELIGAALDGGARHIIVGCGDGGTCDGGFGMAHALGVRFLDAQGCPLPLRADALRRLHAVDVERKDPRLRDVHIEVACNFHGRLTGAESTAKVYGPQKGADAQAVALLDDAMERLAEVMRADLGVDVGAMPGAGAAGGLGAGLHALVGATLRWRYDVIFRYIDLDAHLRACDLVLTGEGTLDTRTFLGKMPSEVARRARTVGVPVVLLAGRVGEGARQALEEGVTAYWSIADGPLTVSESMARAEELVTGAAEAVVRLYAAGHGQGLAAGEGADG
jgi:glycerate 2-kinase